MIAIVLLLCLLATAANAISASELVGTWTTKSRSVVTGPVSDKVCFQEEMQADTMDRDSLIPSTTVSSSPNIREFPIRLPKMGSMRQPTTAPSPIVSIYIYP